ncbi:unnamed protein product, partial [Mesorhabditis belari]|uniref:Uncharacterized protein n=1 Tax=Mesorhabditis belari TaxID=2138241 RepID=A0AAF3F2N9_9BILA
MWQRICLENGYVELKAPSFRFLGGWAANRANEQAGITIFSHMNLQEAHQNRREREVAYGQCYERSPWKSLYLRKMRITSNWRSRAIQSSTVLKGRHLSTRCLQIQSDRIFTPSSDTSRRGSGMFTSRVWNVDNAQPAFTLTGHMNAVWTYAVSDDGKYIVSLSADRTVPVWCGQTGVQRHVLRGHTGFIECISLHGTTLVTGSSDETLRVWDIVDGKCHHILAGHVEPVRCVQFDGERAVSGVFGYLYPNDFTVKVWNVHTEKCLHTLTRGHTDRVCSLLFEPGRDLVVSGSIDATICVWNAQRGTCIARLVLHQGSVGLRGDVSMELRGNILLSCYAGTNWYVQVWDIRDGGSCTHRLQGANSHTSDITSWQLLDSGLLVTGSLDGWVKLWDVDKGIFVRDLARFQSGRSGGCIWRLEATETLLEQYLAKRFLRTQHVAKDLSYFAINISQDRTFSSPMSSETKPREIRFSPFRTPKRVPLRRRSLEETPNEPSTSGLSPHIINQALEGEMTALQIKQETIEEDDHANPSETLSIASTYFGEECPHLSATGNPQGNPPSPQHIAIRDIFQLRMTFPHVLNLNPFVGDNKLNSDDEKD